jgi:threonine efflux protein
MLESLPLILGVLLAQLSPGPNSMAVTSIALGSGRKAGIVASAGIAVGVFTWAVLFTFGIAAFFQIFPQSITFIKLLGGSYLLFLAAKAGYGVLSNGPSKGQHREVRKSNKASFLTGLLVVLTNPKAAMMWIAISTFLASSSVAHADFIVLGLVLSASAMVIYSTYAVLFSSNLVSHSFGLFSNYINTAFALVFGSLGAKLVIDGMKELRS